MRVPSTGPRPSPNPSQARLLDEVEMAVRSVVHPLSCAGCFTRQAAMALEAAGLDCTAEVNLPGTHLRVDLVIVDVRGSVAWEADGRDVRPGTLTKFRLLPPDVLRFLVLRNRRQRPVVPHADRVVCLSTSHRPLQWLTEGHGPAVDPITGSLADLPRMGPRSADVPASLLRTRRAR